MSEEIKPEIIEKTQKMLGKYVTKPSLTEKLLRKPPFRFLHDVIVAVIRDTGFLSGLYTEAELVSDNVKERDAKIAFLTKLIEATKTVTKTELSVKPSKIIAGLEPKETNKLLQVIAMALDKKLSSEGYVKEFKSGTKAKSITKINNEKTKVKKTSKPSTRTEENLKESYRSKLTKDQKVKAEKTIKKENTDKQSKHRKITEKQNKTELEKSKEDTQIISNVNEISSNIDQNVSIQETMDNTALISNTNEKENIEIHSDLPKVEEIVTSNSIALEKKDDSQPENAKPEEIIKFNRNDRPKSARPQTAVLKKESKDNLTEEMKHSTPKNEIPARPMSSLRPPSIRPSSARPGAPRLRIDSALPKQESLQMGKINVIVENFCTKETDEEETVVIRTTDSNSDVQSVAEVLDIPADKGHLVEQILEQIHEDDVAEQSRPKTDIDWEHDGFRNRDATNKEITQMRSSIQALTRAANPLAKLMNYLHEDVEAIHSELNMWISMKNQIWNEINTQKRINKDANKPLTSQLEELEENIKKQEEEIRSVRFNILRNELRIKELLIK